MYNDFYNTTTVPTRGVDSTWLIVSAVLAFVGGIAIYLLFVAKKKDKKFTGFVSWLYDFLNFKKFFINVVLKVSYIVTALYITLSSFSFIGKSVASFFMILVLGNIFARICYEMILMALTIVNNTNEINEKLSLIKGDDKSNSKPKKKSDDEE